MVDLHGFGAGSAGDMSVINYRCFRLYRDLKSSIYHQQSATVVPGLNDDCFAVRAGVSPMTSTEHDVRPSWLLKAEEQWQLTQWIEFTKC